MAQARLLLIPRELRDLIYRFTFAGPSLTLYGPVPEIITIYELSQYLNDFAKYRLKHIRHVPPSLRIYSGSALLNKLGLDQFPRLEKWEIVGFPSVYAGSHNEIENGDEQSWLNRVASMQFRDRDPHNTLEEWELVFKQYKVEFLMRFMIYAGDPPNGRSQTFPKRIWVNMTTKKYFIKVQPRPWATSEDEEGFRHLSSLMKLELKMTVTAG
ncbi:hypothetical protein CIB48_g10519 [Xylaria polymorpha]|nr:hypothetical protein CIB48_g10519 [Xylaria polymorpha]